MNNKIKDYLTNNFLTNNFFIKLVGTVLVYFVIRVNQTDLLKHMYEKCYYRGTKLYTYYDILFPYEISSFVILVVLVYFIFKAPSIESKWYDFLAGMGCGLCSLLGLSFRISQSWDCVVYFKLQSLIYIVGFTYAAIIIIKYFKAFVARLNCNDNVREDTNINFDILQSSISVFVFVFSIWLIWALFRFPGGINYDEYHQINFILDKADFNQHWPVMTTYYYGGLVKLGQIVFHSKNIGLFLAIIGQMLLGTYVITKADGIMKSQDVNIKIRRIIVVIYAINPLIARYMTTASKDSLYSGLLLGVTVLLGEILLCGGVPKPILNY